MGFSQHYINNQAFEMALNAGEASGEFCAPISPADQADVYQLPEHVLREQRRLH